MEHDEFIGQVQHRARLSSRGEAEIATRAALETLAELLAGGEADDLASQLPRGIAEYLRTGLAGVGERFSVGEFFQRVSLREGVDLPKTIYHARAVIAVLYEAVSPGRWAMCVRNYQSSTRGSLSQTGKKPARRERGGIRT